MCIYRNVVRSLVAVGIGTSAGLGFASTSAAQLSAEATGVFAAPSIDLAIAGDAVAWTHEESGKRSLYAARAPDYRTSRVDGALAGTWRRDSVMGPTSPDGAWVLYLSDGLLYRLPADAEGMAGGDPADEPLFRTTGVITEAVWSPDGSRIAFVMAAPKARSGGIGALETVPSFIGVLDLGSGSRWFLRPARERDSSPVWSKDGREIFFQRAASGPLVESVSADAADVAGATDASGGTAVLVGDVESGEVRVLWTPDEDVTLVGPVGGEGDLPVRDGFDRLPVRAETALGTRPGVLR